MLSLFMNECRRFKFAAMVFTAVHLVLELLVNRITDIPNTHWNVHMMILFVFMVSGFAFGAYQFGTYRQPSRWLWLLHRPLSPRAIFCALTAASSCLIIIAVGLPALLALGVADLFSARTVDLRHYLMVLQLLVLTIIAWLAGGYVMLNRKYSAIVVLLLPYLLLIHFAPAPLMLACGALCLALMLVLAEGVFNPARLNPRAGSASMQIAAVVLMIGMYIGLVTTETIAFRSIAAMTEKGMAGRQQSVPGGHINARSRHRDVLLEALAGSSDARVPQWRTTLAQLKIDERHYNEGVVAEMGNFFPLRGELGNSDSPQFRNHATNTEWTFSHDTMRYHLRDLDTGADRGWYGAGGANDPEPFPSVPVAPWWVPGELPLLTAHRLYRISADKPKPQTVISLPAREFFSGTPIAAEGRHFLLTNLHLSAFRQQQQGDTTTFAPLFQIPLPGPFSDFIRADIAGVADGMLVALTSGARMADGFNSAPQVLYYVGSNLVPQLVGQRALVHPYPTLYEHRAWITSPLLFAVQAATDFSLSQSVIPDRDNSVWAHLQLLDRPAQASLAAILLTVLSGIAGWHWLRQSTLTTRQKAGWVLACLVFGLPALLAMLVLQSGASRHAAAAAPQAQPFAQAA
jgi:hypothetical protein